MCSLNEAVLARKISKLIKLWIIRLCELVYFATFNGALDTLALINGSLDEHYCYVIVSNFYIKIMLLNTVLVLDTTVDLHGA